MTRLGEEGERGGKMTEAPIDCLRDPHSHHEGTVKAESQNKKHLLDCHLQCEDKLRQSSPQFEERGCIVDFKISRKVGKTMFVGFSSCFFCSYKADVDVDVPPPQQAEVEVFRAPPSP